ncbi:MAG: class D sortase [Xanthomonadales bacterium]|jgi:sortase A|nr:class D sortase [Xanthomonadales bacterium]MDH3923963.1 class D sortase [Xanthomonadales bacterium]MDH3940573.1 class D sortase [Xanthomonadales bacterium]MDH4002142.1 class D sortase [Xanthomonadales bacterium]
MVSRTLKKKLGWLEIGLYLGGVVLLVVFFQIRTSGERQREEGIRVFQESVEAAGQAVQDAQSEQSEWSPNQELWADKRIREYEESLQVEAGPPLALLTIDKVDIEVPVYNGTDEFNLNRGVGRIIGTAHLEAEGNLGIAGHRDGFFRGLKDVEVGDEIRFQTARGEVLYTVSSILIVDPSDVSVLAPTPERTLTLVTCYPFYYVGHAPKRYIVTATAKHLLAKT